MQTLATRLISRLTIGTINSSRDIRRTRRHTASRPTCPITTTSPRSRPLAADPDLSHHGPGCEEHIGRPLRQTPHVPRKPLTSVADQHAHPIAFLGQSNLIGSADPKQKVELEGLAWHVRVTSMT